MGLINVDKFRFFSQVVLPAVYDESLSYYEVLNKVRYKLNEVIDSTNAQNDVIRLFIEEINNAVDDFIHAMVSDYDTTKSYVKGNYCWYDNALYKCKGNTSGSFDSAVWDEVVFADAIGEDVRLYSEKVDSLISQVAPAYRDYFTYEVGEMCVYEDVVYVCRTRVYPPEPFDPEKWERAIITTELKNRVDNYWNEFISDYQQTLGVVQSTGKSVTNVISQKGVTDFVTGGSIDIVWERGGVVGSTGIVDPTVTTFIHSNLIPYNENYTIQQILDTKCVVLPYDSDENIIQLDPDNRQYIRTKWISIHNLKYLNPSYFRIVVDKGVHGTFTPDDVVLYGGSIIVSSNNYIFKKLFTDNNTDFSNSIMYNNINYINFENGSINDSGELTDSTTRKRTTDFITINKNDFIYVPSALYRIAISYYTADNIFIKSSGFISARKIFWLDDIYNSGGRKIKLVTYLSASSNKNLSTYNIGDDIMFINNYTVRSNRGYITKEDLTGIGNIVNGELVIDNSTGTSQKNLQVRYPAKTKTNQIIKTTTMWTGTNAPSVSFITCQAQGSGLSNNFGTTGVCYFDSKDNYKTNRFRFPTTVIDNMECCLYFKIPVGTTLYIRDFENEYSNEINRNSIPRLAAHHGYTALARQGTQAACELAAELGYWGNVVTPKLSGTDPVTGTKTWFIYHDDNLDISTTFIRKNDGSRLTYADVNESADPSTTVFYWQTIPFSKIETWDFGVSFNKIYKGARVLKLDEFFELCKNTGMTPILSMHPSYTMTQTNLLSLKALADKCGITNKLEIKTGIKFEGGFDTTNLSNIITVFGNSVYEYTIDMAVDGNEENVNDYCGYMQSVINQYNTSHDDLTVKIGIEISDVNANETVSNIIKSYGYTPQVYERTSFNTDSLKNLSKLGFEEFVDKQNPHQGLNY